MREPDTNQPEVSFTATIGNNNREVNLNSYTHISNNISLQSVLDILKANGMCDKTNEEIEKTEEANSDKLKGPVIHQHGEKSCVINISNSEDIEIGLQDEDMNKVKMENAFLKGELSKANQIIQAYADEIKTLKNLLNLHKNN